MLTEKQLKARKSGIGGSEVAAILGISPWKSAVDVYREKTESLPAQQELDINDPRYWGHAHEPQVIKAYEKSTGNTVKSVDTLFDKEHPFLMANIDGFTHDRVVIEAKTTSSTKGWGDEGTDQIPQYYLTQVAHYAYITDCKHVDIAVLFFGNRFKLYRYERNEKLEQAIKAKLIDFWLNNVQKVIPPEPKTLADVNYLYKAREEPVTANSETIETINQIRDVSQQIAELKAKKDALEISVKTFMKDNSILLNDDGEKLAMWKGVTTNRFDSSSLKTKNPEIYNQFIKTTESRRFSIK